MSCIHMHEKLTSEEKILEERCPRKEERAEFILGNHGRELCDYCLTKCPDRFQCTTYSRDAKWINI